MYTISIRLKREGKNIMRKITFHSVNIASGFTAVYFGIQAVTATINYIALPLLLVSCFVLAYNNNYVK